MAGPPASGPDAGDPAMLAERLSVRYHILPVARAAALPAGLGDRASQWVKAQWLFPAETRLIDVLRPACNAETLPGTERDDVTGALFDAAVLAAFAEPVVGGEAGAARPQPAGDIIDVTDDRLADDAAPPEAPMLDEEGSPILAPGAISDDDDGDRSILDRLEDAAPHRFTVYPTGAIIASG